ncbi:uncharacterized protein [Palaemon carinicauda]|uniref:uncharacterized protein n=1 Tax=Palaemon carinicauda TaxID=392227 RepID=UPI0035B5AC80
MSTSYTSALLSNWIVIFCIPEHITSDSVTTFISLLRKSLENLLNITFQQTTAYNPAANAEMVYGNSWSFLPIFFSLLSHPVISSAYMFWENLLNAFRLTSHQLSNTCLKICTRHILRNDNSKPRLLLPDTFLFFVILHTPKAFLLNLHGKEDKVSIHCLKPAYLLPDDPPSASGSRTASFYTWLSVENMGYEILV